MLQIAGGWVIIIAEEAINKGLNRDMRKPWET
jgi:hypothetical protein